MSCTTPSQTQSSSNCCLDISGSERLSGMPRPNVRLPVSCSLPPVGSRIHTMARSREQRCSVSHASPVTAAHRAQFFVLRNMSTVRVSIPPMCRTSCMTTRRCPTSPQMQCIADPNTTSRPEALHHRQGIVEQVSTLLLCRPQFQG